MKKVLAVIAVIVVVCAAGAAFAQPRGQNDSRRMPHQIQQGHCGEFGHRNGRLGLTPDMPEEIRAKVVEAAKLRIDLEAEMSAKTIDRPKTMEIFGKIQQAENAVEMWKFGKRLERMEDFRTQRELNRKIPPARRMHPAPQDEAPEAPEAPAPEE